MSVPHITQRGPAAARSVRPRRLLLQTLMVVFLLGPTTAQVPTDIDVPTVVNGTGLVADCVAEGPLADAAPDPSTGPAGAAIGRLCRASDATAVDRAVTGHTVHFMHAAARAAEVRFPVRDVATVPDASAAALPSPTPSPLLPMRHGAPPSDEIRMAECVGWTNGYNVDARPSADATPWMYNRHFSDADHPQDHRSSHDVSGQDHDPGHHVLGCLPTTVGLERATAPVGMPTDFAIVAGALVDPDGASFGRFAIVVERGDCAPSEGSNFRFRAHLDFVDPNNLYHEVHEYDYVCPSTGPGNAIPADAAAAAGDQLAGPRPDDDPTAPTGRCDPLDIVDDDAPAASERRCRGTVQDLLRERLWITPVHMGVYDPAMETVYTFALSVDTCAAINVQDGFASRVAGHQVTPLDRSLDHGGYTRDRSPHPLYGVARETDARPAGSADDACTDGSSFSFDDTERGIVVHHAPPADRGSLEIRDGNSFDFDPGSATFLTHRTNCRLDALEWPYNELAPEASAYCYAEDHRAALVDVYVYEEDPTGLFAGNWNGMTGPNAYHGPGPASWPGPWPPEE